MNPERTTKNVNGLQSADRRLQSNIVPEKERKEKNEEISPLFRYATNTTLHVYTGTTTNLYSPTRAAK